jgi:hypothetical protein
MMKEFTINHSLENPANSPFDHTPIKITNNQEILLPSLLKSNKPFNPSLMKENKKSTYILSWSSIL